MEEGLGSEFLLIHETLRLHHGKFLSTREEGEVAIQLVLPELSGEAALRAVLASRAFQVSSELGSVALVLIPVPVGSTSALFGAEIKKNLFRTSDAVYLLPERELVALVLDDCKAEDAPRLVERIGKKSHKLGNLVYGIAQCPADGLDPALLLPLAEQRLKST
jgi:hypothetical protein